MTAVVVLRLPLDTDLSGFVALLQRLRVPHRVAEEGGQQVLWVPSEALAEQVRELYARHPQGDARGELPSSPTPVREGLLAQLRRSPLTALVLLTTFIVFAVTLAGENFAAIRWLSFVDFRIDGESLYLNYLDATLSSGQWWRLITP
ncbi:MAG: rhomboid family intramembrane serine protease, partial [Pseudomonas sp.]|nr:rhomboid family intramembrane serine protease [Pseudomonas sp.]